MLCSIRSLALFLATASPAWAFDVGVVEVHYLDATDPDNAITLSAEPGDYEIYPAYDANHDPGAWNAWGQGPSDCESDGTNCNLGFMTQYSIDHSGGTIVSNAMLHEDGVTRRVYETADIALENAATESLCLEATGAITLRIEDDVYTDNLYGLAVHVVRLNDTCGGSETIDSDTGDGGAVDTGSGGGAEGGCGCSSAPATSGAWVLLAIALAGSRRQAPRPTPRRPAPGCRLGKR